MRIKRFFLSILLIFALLLGVPTASAAEGDDLVCQMLNYYRHYQEDGWTDILRLLEQLEHLVEDKNIRVDKRCDGEGES